MSEYWTNGVATLYQADARALPLADKSVHCCVTSPPYWGLRDYNLGQWEGGDNECDHVGRPVISGGQSEKQDSHTGSRQGDIGPCLKCGAQRLAAGIGLEPTLSEWLKNIVAVGREVWRVLRDDGTWWLNLGDAYAGSGKGPAGPEKQSSNASATMPPVVSAKIHDKTAKKWGLSSGPVDGLAPKSLMGQPWRAAFALQDDGWILRSAIVWHKPNPMPESVQDRPTNAYEMVFLLTKQGRYFYDAEAVRQPYSESVIADKRDNGNGARRERDFTGAVDNGGTNLGGNRAGGANLRNVWTIPTQGRPNVVSYGSYRIGIPDCPVHGCREYLTHALQCGELRCASPSDHNRRIDASPLPGQEGVAYAISVGRSGLAVNIPAAIAHSTEIRKMACELGLHDFCACISASDIECSEAPDRSVSTSGRSRGSKTSEDCASDETGFGLSGQTGSHIFGIATFLDPPVNCSCHYTGRVSSEQGHYAAFPDELPRRCILAGTSEKGVCAECGAPWVRVVEKETSGEQPRIGHNESLMYDRKGRAGEVATQTLGWQPTCDCNAATVPATVLDHFVGSGTTLAVAQELGRRGVGTDLNPEYLDIARRRISDVPYPMRLY